MNYEDIIDQALELLKAKANNYSPFSDQYYIVVSNTGDESAMNETGSCENFCEECIDQALVDYKNNFYLERAKLLVKIAMAEQFGHYVESYLEEYCPGEFTKVCTLKDDRILMKFELPKGVDFTRLRIYSKALTDYNPKTIFDYQHSQADSGNGFVSCDLCGHLFNCFWMSEQEIEHWEEHYGKPGDLVIKDMSDSISWELQTIFENWSEKDELQERVVSIAKNLIEQNTEK